MTKTHLVRRDIDTCYQVRMPECPPETNMHLLVRDLIMNSDSKERNIQLFIVFLNESATKDMSLSKDL